MNTSNENAIRPLKPVGEYDWPSLPAERTVLSLLDRVKDLIGVIDDEPAIKSEQLQRTTEKRDDSVASFVGCEQLDKEIDSAITTWLQSPDSQSPVYLMVFPPCQQRNSLETWAQARAYDILQTPPREALLESPVNAVELQGEGILVIPELSSWYLRHRNGLGHIDSLLCALSTTTRPCVVGCNSWAWQFLGRAVEANQYLPEPVMFQAFDSLALRQHLIHVARESDEDRICFRESTTGDDVLALDSQGDVKGDYLRSLAAQSLGIPWVAQLVWRQSLRTVRDGDAFEDEAAEPPENGQSEALDTLWLVQYQKPTLAKEYREAALLVLHALLLHGKLTQDELSFVLPIMRVSAQVQMLKKAGFLNDDDGVLSCASIAYPAARQYLSDSGFPMDNL